MPAIAEICAACGLVVAEKKTATMPKRSPSMKVELVEVEAAGYR